MAFALTRFEARSIDIASVTYKRGVQQVVMDITGSSADVDLDIGDDAGTFWTAAIANATYGTLATNALAVLQKIVAQAAALVAVQSQQLLDRIQIATVSGAGQYSLAVVNTRPNLAFNAGDGETAYKIILTYELNNYIQPIAALYGQA